MTRESRLETYWRKSFLHKDGTCRFSSRFDVKSNIDMTALAAEHGTCDDEQYEFVREIAYEYSNEEMVSVIEIHVEKEEKKKQEEAKERQRVADEAELHRMAKKLGKRVV